MKKSLLSNIAGGVKHQLSKLSKALHDEDHGISIFKLKYLKHLPKADVVRKLQTKFGDISFTSAPDLYHSLEEIFSDKIYLQQLAPDSYILDCGSNIGLSILYLKSVCPGATIEGFEPDVANFALLQKNVQGNGLTNVILHQKAVWNANTTLMFENKGSLASKVDAHASTGTKVEAARLRDFINRPVDFLKIDIEGAEYPVMLDIEDKLDLVKVMFLEYHGSFVQNNELLHMLEMVRKAGFNFYIREAGLVYKTPFYRPDDGVTRTYDVQLNIFCFREPSSNSFS